jgi:hypothetical protein
MPQSEEHASLTFQLYGFPPHFANTVFESFSRHLLGDGPISWPPTSPSFTPMRFYF